MRYSEMKRELDATWYEQPQKVRVLAARYYVGAESSTSLLALTKPRHIGRNHTLDPLLTETQARHIINCR